MWHQSGTPGKTTWNEAKKLMQRLNNRGYEGYHDWRLPALEEATSLLEPGKKNGGLFILPVFDRNQEWIWTGDKKKGANAAWNVNFRYGLVTWSSLNDRGFVRPVLSLSRTYPHTIVIYRGNTENTTISHHLREGLKKGLTRCEE